MFDSFRKTPGERGERLAAKHYRRDAYRVLEQNFRTRQGEIDLIVQKGGTLAFVEVKTRDPHAIAQPREFVTAQKQRRLILAARRYLMLHPERADSTLRFDVVEVVLSRWGGASLHRIENAFTL